MVVVVWVPPLGKVSITVALGIPTSPASCIPLPLASLNTKSPRLALPVSAKSTVPLPLVSSPSTPLAGSVPANNVTARLRTSPATLVFTPLLSLLKLLSGSPAFVVTTW